MTPGMVRTPENKRKMIREGLLRKSKEIKASNLKKKVFRGEDSVSSTTKTQKNVKKHKKTRSLIKDPLLHPTQAIINISGNSSLIPEGYSFQSRSATFQDNSNTDLETSKYSRTVSSHL